MGGQLDLRGNQFPGWIGHLQKTAGSITGSDANSGAHIFTPIPLRGIVATGAGNVVVTLNGEDDINDAAKKVTLVLSANVPETRFAIAKVWGTNTTATGLTGFY